MMSYQIRLSTQLLTFLSRKYTQHCYASTVCTVHRRRESQITHVYPTRQCIHKYSGILAISSLHHQQLRHDSTTKGTWAHYYSPDFPPVGFAQKVLEVVHDTTGLPWWGTILLTTMALRVFITMPVFLIAQWNQAKILSLKPILREEAEVLSTKIIRLKQVNGWDEKRAEREFKRQMVHIVRDHYEEERCHPMKSFLVMFSQIPVFISVSFALRNMSGLPVFGTVSVLNAVRPDLKDEGLLWFTNFMVPDPLYILPIIFTLSSLANTEVLSLSTPEQTRTQRIVTNIFRGFCVVLLPIAMCMPSCMVYYWTCSSVYAMMQTLAVISPRVRRVLHLPELANQSKTPYKQLVITAKHRLTKPFRRKNKSDDNPS